MRIVNGRWVDECDNRIEPIHNGDFSDLIDRLRYFTRGRELTHSKINILSQILDTDDEYDAAMVNVLGMDKKTLKQLF